MQLLNVLLLTCLAFTTCTALVTTAGTFGTSISVNGSTDYEINFPGSGKLELRLNGDATVKMSLVVSASTSLPDGCQSLSFGANVGYTFEVTPSSVAIVHATFSTPTLSVAAIALLSGSVQASCLQFDSAAQFYSALDVTVQTVNVVDKQIVVELPSAGSYVFVVIDTEAFLPTFFNHERDVNGGEHNKFSFPGGLFLEFVSETSNKLVVNGSTSNPTPKEADGKVSYGTFFMFTAEQEENIIANISFAYDKAVLEARGILESSLQIGFYNENSAKWEFMESGGSVDTSAKICTQASTHFSTWGVYGESVGSSASGLQATSMAIITLLLLIVGFGF